MRRLLTIALAAASPAAAQQVADSAFRPEVRAPAYARGGGPVVLVDQAHNNPDAHGGQYRPLVDLLEADGYRVGLQTQKFTRQSLQGVAVLVLVNALADRDVDRWILPTSPALDTLEESVIVEWVRRGGGLLFAADHMPFPGATERLARRFGIEFTNGFAIDTATWDPIVFRRADGSLSDAPMVNGRSLIERVDSIASFDGQGFRVTGRNVRPLMTFRAGVMSYYPDTAWRFPQPWVPVRPMQGWAQGAWLSHGRGRVLVLGEAGMLSAQLAGRRRVPKGMNAPVARQNQQFILNALHWLDGTRMQ